MEIEKWFIDSRIYSESFLFLILKVFKISQARIL